MTAISFVSFVSFVTLGESTCRPQSPHWPSYASCLYERNERNEIMRQAEWGFSGCKHRSRRTAQLLCRYTDANCDPVCGTVEGDGAGSGKS